MLRLTHHPLYFSIFSVAWQANQSMEPHTHEDHELNVVVSGSGRYVFADGHTMHLAAGQILFLPGGWLHHLESDAALTFRGLLIHPELFQRLPASTPTSTPAATAATTAAETFRTRLTDVSAPLPPKVLVAPHLYQTLLEIHGQAQLEIAQPDGFNQTALIQLSHLAAICVLRLCALETPAPQTDPVVQRVLNTKAWIDRHFAEAIALDDLAAMANLSPSHFSSLFRKEVGQAPKAYLLARRLDQAARLLSQTSLSILEIAWSVGFNHLAHFNRSFKAHLAHTPGDYRKKQQKDQRKP